MTKLNYRDIMDIQENATKKLLEYIGDYIKNKNDIKTIEFYYPDFDEDRTAIAFNVWVSLDYRTKEGKYFIEHLLEEIPQALTPLEKEILEERNKSHISLFEVIEIKENYIYVEDLLCRQKYKVLEPDLSKLIKKHDLIFGRIAKVINFKKFVGDVNFLPPLAKEMFIEETFFDYNIVRKNEPNLNIEKYLRKYSSNVYKIYTDCIYKLLDIDDEISNQLAIELDNFKRYLNNKLSKKIVNKYINNLINIYEYCLFGNDLTLHDLNKLSLEPILKEAINDGIIQNQSQLNSYIDTLKYYLNFLRKKDTKYNEVYKEILKISKNRFTYLDINNINNIPIIKNDVLVSALENKLNEKAYNFLIDYKKYLAYIQINNVQVTATKKYIKRIHLVKINSLLENKTDLSHLKAPNQLNIPLLHLFYKFSLNYGILNIIKNKISTSYNFTNYLNLVEEEQFSLFIDYIWNHFSWSEFDTNFKKTLTKKQKYILANILSKLEPNHYYSIEQNINSHFDSKIYSKNIMNLFETMDLLISVETPEIELAITPLGHTVFNNLKSQDNNNKNGKIISLDDYKKRNF